jgi:hypothetical protein
VLVEKGSKQVSIWTLSQSGIAICSTLCPLCFYNVIKICYISDMAAFCFLPCPFERMKFLVVELSLESSNVVENTPND